MWLSVTLNSTSGCSIALLWIKDACCIGISVSSYFNPLTQTPRTWKHADPDPNHSYTSTRSYRHPPCPDILSGDSNSGPHVCMVSKHYCLSHFPKPSTLTFSWESLPQGCNVLFQDGHLTWGSQRSQGDTGQWQLPHPRTRPVLIHPEMWRSQPAESLRGSIPWPREMALNQWPQLLGLQPLTL